MFGQDLKEVTQSFKKHFIYNDIESEQKRYMQNGKGTIKGKDNILQKDLTDSKMRNANKK